MKVELLTKAQFKHLVYRGNPFPLEHYSKSLDDIEFFSFDDIIGFNFASPEYDKTLRFVVAYDSRKIYGVTKFAYWTSSKNYAIAYSSVAKNYINRGICSIMISVLIKYFKETYPLEKFHTSQYTLSGWKFLRPILRKYCNLYNVSFVDSVIGYFIEGDDREEFYKLRELSKQLNGKTY